MNQPAHIVIVSGPPGSGKSSVARRLAEGSPFPRAVHLHTDDFYAYVRKGFIAPWLPEANEQNAVIVEALTASARMYAAGGFEVIVDGVVGPWFLGPWLRAEAEGVDVRYVVLRPDEATTVARAINRKEPGALVDPEPVRKMWQEFANLGRWEGHVVDTTGMSLDETVAVLQGRLAGGELRLDSVAHTS
jgi:predicted kinase